MKVKKINKSSKRTSQVIKEAFAELLSEKKELNKVKVIDLVERAKITRSSFYTHYESIYDVAREIQEETLEILTKNTENINSLEDADKYFDELMLYLKNNEEFYSLLLSSDIPSYYTRKLEKLITSKLYDTLSPLNIKNLELKISFFTDGTLNLIIKYFKKEINTTIDEIDIYLKEEFKKTFLN